MFIYFQHHTACVGDVDAQFLKTRGNSRSKVAPGLSKNCVFATANPGLNQGNSPKVLAS